MLAAPLMAGNDLRLMSPEVLAILTNKEAIAIDQDKLGKEGTRFANPPGMQIWIKELSDGRWAVCYYNSSAEPITAKATWGNFYFMDRTKNYAVRDVWAAKDLCRTDAEPTLNLVVPPVDVVLLTLTPVK
jgi:alpha-galactosidase